MKILYNGIDWLSIGLYVKTEKEEEWNKTIENWKTKIGNEIIKNPFKFQIMTSKALAKQRFSIMLIEQKFNITFKITRPPKKEKIKLVKEGFVKMPDILIEIPAKALRPQNLAYTENAIKEVLNMFNAKVYSFTYSRVDFNIDLYNPSQEELEEILNSFKNSIKKSETGIETEYSNLEIAKEIYNIRKGTKGYKEISAYRTLKRDNELKEIYREKLKKVIDKEELKRIWRVEIRISRKYLRVHRNFKLSKIHKINDIYLKSIIKNAYSIFEDDNTLSEVKEIYINTEKEQLKNIFLEKEITKIDTKQIEYENEEIYKIILGLFNKVYENSKHLYKQMNAEDVFDLFFKNLTKMKDYIEEKAEKKEFYKTLIGAIHYIKDFTKSTFNKNRFILEEIKEDFNYEYQEPNKNKNLLQNLKVRGVSPKTQRKILFDESEIEELAIDF